LSRLRCSEGGFGLWLGDKGIVNGKTSTSTYILTTPSSFGLAIIFHLTKGMVSNSFFPVHQNLKTFFLIFSSIPLGMYSKVCQNIGMASNFNLNNVGLPLMNNHLLHQLFIVAIIFSTNNGQYFFPWTFGLIGKPKYLKLDWIPMCLKGKI
jgi:hypothetical protein